MPVKSKGEISQNFVAFSEYMNFKGVSDLETWMDYFAFPGINCNTYFNFPTYSGFSVLMAIYLLPKSAKNYIHSSKSEAPLNLYIQLKDEKRT